MFFILFKWYGIYHATAVGMAMSFVQVMMTRWWWKKWDSKQIITLGVFLLFGSMTLYFHNPIFIKWKPSIVFWLFAICLEVSQHVGRTPLIQRLFQSALQEEGRLAVPSTIWRRLNRSWGVFFIILGIVNLYIAYTYDSNTWVNFKFYGITGLLLLFSIAQACYLARYATVKSLPSSSHPSSR